MKKIIAYQMTCCRVCGTPLAQPAVGHAALVERPVCSSWCAVEETKRRRT